jgi:hypothetical protein
LNGASRRSFDNAHGRCAIGSKKIAVSEEKIVPLADSSWIKLNKKVFCFFFFKKRNAIEKELAGKLHCFKLNKAISTSNSLLKIRLELTQIIISTLNSHDKGINPIKISL